MWEYEIKQLTDPSKEDMESILKDMQEWELVSVTPYTHPQQVTVKFSFFFKRESKGTRKGKL